MMNLLLRWKNKYLMGRPKIDHQTGLFKESLVESSQVEHDQELHELHQHLLETSQTLLFDINSSVFQLDDQTLQGIHSTTFPLPRGNPSP